MPIDSRHPEYLKYIPQWTRARHAMEGSDSVKGHNTLAIHAFDPETIEMQAMATWRTDMAMTQGRAYLPKPTGMSERDYQAYKTRATWFGASARVRQGLVGLVFREPPEVAAPPVVLEHAKDITRTGMPLEVFTYHMVLEDCTTGRFGILLDLPEEEQPANAVQPQWTLYTAEHIINWHCTRTPRGETVYEWIILEEEVDALAPEDPYKHVRVKQWRELCLIEGIYVIRLWQKTPGSTDQDRFMLVEEPRIPTRRGAPLDFLPFAMDEALESPPLLDVVDVNFAHYRTNADYKHSLHLSALATPYITGHDNLEAVFNIGASTAWVIPEPAAKVGFLEVSGSGLNAMLEDMRAAEAQMAILGARLLEPQKKAVEAAQTHEIRQSSELSIMQAYAQAASLLVTKALRWHTWWAGATTVLDDERVTFTLNTDFLPTTIDGPQLTAFVGAWQQGALTQADLYYNLSQGNLLAPGVTFDQWQAQLAEEAEAKRVLAQQQAEEAAARAQALARVTGPAVPETTPHNGAVR
jgi:hypothetical protein